MSNLAKQLLTDAELWKPENPCSLCKWQWEIGTFERKADSSEHRFLRNIAEVYADIIQSAASGDCFSCSMLAGALKNFVPSDISRIEEINISEWQNNGITIKLDLRPQAARQLTRDSIRIELLVSNLEQEPPYETLKLRIPSGDTSSDSALRWAQGWLDHCIRSHEKCNKDQESVLPTRVIDVTPINENGDVKLVDQAHLLPAALYVALSHCWGKHPIQCWTTRRTLESRRERIPFALLTKTFQDAVVFTRRLGVRYLWIDAMCIIQEDVEDWRPEAGRMSSVYGNALVTLAAVHAADGSGGLFSELSTDYQAFALDPIMIGGKNWYFSARKKLPPFHTWTLEQLGDHGEESAPLFDRAWTYQERIMSPRVLFFSENELLWECCEDNGCECVADAGASTASHASKQGLEYYPKINHIMRLEHGEAAARWREVVREYSKLQLTVETDKLPGISAIARQVQRFRPSAQYIAGLWSETLVMDLLWEICSSDDNKGAELDRRRPEEWCAPTWSWASVLGEVWYPTTCNEAHALHQRHFPEIIAVHCNHMEDDEFGQVQSGRLVLKGQLTECKLELSTSPPKLSHPEAQQDFTLQESFSLDVSLGNEPENEQLRDSESLHLLRCYEDPDQVCHLLLRRANLDETGVYKRVGMVLFFDLGLSRRLFSGEEDRVLTIQ